MHMRSGGPGFESPCALQEKTMPNGNCTHMHRLPTLSLPGRRPNLQLSPCIKKGREHPVSPSHGQACRTHSSADVCSLFLKDGNTAESVLFVKDGKTFFTVH